MEAYSSWAVPVVVGGVVGRILPPEDGRFLGGCVGCVRLSRATRRHVGGCAGHVFQPGPGRFVGGCVGFVEHDMYRAPVRARVHERARSEAPARWGDEALEAAA